jgi:uncharacterized protein
MKILDSHIHIFNSKIIENVISRTELVSRLSLQKEGIYNRLDTTALLDGMDSADVQAALMLPTSDVGNLLRINRTCIKLVSEIPELFTAGTLHPDYNNVTEELSYLSHAGVRVIKLCSFSQGFALDQPGTHKMFQLIQTFNKNSKTPFSVVLDTLTLADQYFGTDPTYTTTPRGLWDLASCFSEINFIGAHMGGLGASCEELNRDLKPLPNLYLDTSNASHTLSTDQFVRMLHTHGPKHILFGTDWPWFLHRSEVNRIEELMEKAGFNKQDKEAVFSSNLENLLGIINEN